MEKTICELFAGVGGFRLGFDRLESGWRTTWFSQWEPGAKTQWAHDCYVRHFGLRNVCQVGMHHRKIANTLGQRHMEARRKEMVCPCV